MARAKSEFRKYVDQAQDLPDDVVLGNIVWHTVVDGAYPLAAINDAFEHLGLNPSFIPPPTTAFNAFEKACTKALNATKPYDLDSSLGHQRTGEIMAIREIASSNDMVVRHIIREVRDSRAKRLRHEAVAELTFIRQPTGADGRVDRNTAPQIKATIWSDTLMPGEEDQVRAVTNRWAAEFDRLFNYVDGDKTRAIVRNYLGFLNAVMMKSGIYFVHKNREDELLLLQQFVIGLTDHVTGESACQLEMMPIPEIKRLRESVIEAFQDEAVKELTEVVAAIAKVRSQRATITAPALAKIQTQYEAVMRKANEYTRTLHCTQDRTAGAAEMAMESLRELHADMRKQMEA